MNFILWATVWSRLIIHLLSVSLPAVCVAQVPQDESGATSGTISEAPLAIERDSLEAFLDPLVGLCLDKFHVPGVVVVVVHAGETVIAKGYGSLILKRRLLLTLTRHCFALLPYPSRSPQPRLCSWLSGG